MKGEGTITRKQERCVAALLECRTLAEAAKVAGVSERSLRYWLRREDFRAEYRRAAGRLLESAIATLQATAGEAASALRDGLESKHPVGVRLAAAKAILDRALRGVELLDIEARLSTIESRLEGRL